VRKESQITKLINIYLDGLVSVGNDAGWVGDSMLSKMIDFGGEPPRGSGMDQSNLSMINALSLYRDKHHEFANIERVVHRLLSKPVTAMYITALLIEHYYHAQNERTGKAYTDEDRASLWGRCAAELGVTEVLKLSQNEALRVYRYGARRAGPRLVRREAGL